MAMHHSSTTSEYLKIIKDFMIDLHGELSQSDPAPIQQQHIQIIDQAVIQLKTNKQNLLALQNTTAQMNEQKGSIEEYRKQCQHLEKRINRKLEEIDILKQTVKNLYKDNQKLARQKQQISKQMVSLKELNSSLKKKIHRQEEQMSRHKNELEKLTSLAEQRLNQYLKEDQQKQLKIKKLMSENEKNKADLAKKEKTVASLNKKVEGLKKIEADYQESLNLVETLNHEVKANKEELEALKERTHDQKLKFLSENQENLRELENMNDKLSKVTGQRHELSLKLQEEIEKNTSYEEQILMRTQKLKQKNKQIKVYNDEIEKLARRIQELSNTMQEMMVQNKDMAHKCRVYEQKFEQFGVLHSHLGKLKGQINQKKSVQLAKLIDSINRLQGSL